LGLRAWTPVTALAAILFYANRTLRRRDVPYGYAGAGALALIIGFEAPLRYLGLSWFLFAGCLFAFGWIVHLRDFRIQEYVVAGLGLVGTAAHEIGVATGNIAAIRHPWVALSCTAMLSYLAILVALRSAQDRMEDWERSGIRMCGS
jgi:hypothetical protein